MSGVGAKLARDPGDPLEGLGGDADTGAAAAPSKPTFDHSGGQTVTINADSAIDFANSITATIGAPHCTPVFTPDIQTSFKTNASGQKVPGSEKIDSIGLDVKTSITKVRFGTGRPNEKHKAAIDQMVAKIQAHEEAHRKIIEDAATAALAAAQKKYVGSGKTAEAKKALTTDLEKTTNAGHTALDAKEGKLTASEAADGSVTVTAGPSGAKY